MALEMLELIVSPKWFMQDTQIHLILNQYIQISLEIFLRKKLPQIQH